MFYEEKSCFSFPHILEVISIIKETRTELLQQWQKKVAFKLRLPIPREKCIYTKASLTL